MVTMTAADTHLKWRDMSAVQKVAWWGKFVIALATFGFVYPHVMEPHLKD